MAVIPSTASRSRAIPHNKRLYKERNRIGRMWCRSKIGVASPPRYDKLARNYTSGAYLAALIACWLN